MALDWPTWLRAMEETRVLLGLDDDALVEVVAHWQASPRQGRPGMDRLWYRASRAWVRRAAKLDETPAGVKLKPNGEPDMVALWSSGISGVAS